MMKILKEKSAGFYLTVLAMVLGAAGLVCYLVNAGTSYFVNLGVDGKLVACVALALVLQLALLLASGRYRGPVILLDLLPVLSAVLLVLGFVTFVSLRVNSIATILSFERNAQTMSDLSSAIIGMACCLLAVIVTVVSSFCAVVKEA